LIGLLKNGLITVLNSSARLALFFLRYLKEQQLDQVYKKAYEQTPEELEMAQVSALFAGEIMEKENWE
jgi:hypothetical protein